VANDLRKQDEEFINRLIVLVMEFENISDSTNSLWRFKLAVKVAKENPKNFHEFVKMLTEADVVRRGLVLGVF